MEANAREGSVNLEGRVNIIQVSKRHIQLMRSIGNGDSPELTARKLGIEVSTVRNYNQVIKDRVRSAVERARKRENQ